MRRIVKPIAKTVSRFKIAVFLISLDPKAIKAKIPNFKYFVCVALTGVYADAIDE